MGSLAATYVCISMHTAQVLEWPHPQIDQDWDSGQHRWREITPLAYRELKTATTLRAETENAFMQSEPVDILSDGDGLTSAASGRTGAASPDCYPESTGRNETTCRCPKPGGWRQDYSEGDRTFKLSATATNL